MGHDTRSPARGQELAAQLPWALAFLRKLGASDDEAEDLAQKALLGALENWSTFDPARGTPLRAWLTGIVKNQWLDYRRWRRTRKETPFHRNREETVQPSCESAVMALDTLRFLSRSTSPERWSVIVARAEGSTGFETATQEGTSTGTAYDRARRGQPDLAAALRREDAAAAGPMVRRRPRSKP